MNYIEPIEEFGEVYAALQVALRMQADYARQDSGVSRAMRDVAVNCVYHQIRKLLQTRAKP